MSDDTPAERPSSSAGRAVTFLFTDVEGSTALLRRVGARAYAGALAEHDAILREAVTAHGGSVVDTQGDAMFAAFGDATGASEAAQSAQRELTQRSWPEGESLRVRMGLHLGEPEVSQGRYLGLDVHLAARICAAAHGGQIVLSAAVAHSLHESSVGPPLRPLGAHRLKDFDSAQELFQLDWGDGVPAFPPLRTGTASSDVGRFEGREDELATAAAAAIARSARRSERRRVLAVVAAAAAVGSLVAAYVLTQPTPVAVRGNSIAVLDAGNGRVIADVPLTGTPTALAAGAGAIWAVSSGGTLTRIDEATLSRSVSGIKYDSKGPTDVGAGFGHVWVVNGFDRSVTLVTPRGTAPQVRIPLTKGLGVLGIGDSHIAIGDSAVWIDNGGAAGVTRLTPATLKTTRAPQLPTGAIAAGAGAVWVGGARDYFGSGSVTELDSATGQPVATFRLGEVDGLTAGLGHAWVTDATTGVVEPLDPVHSPPAGQPSRGRIASGAIGRPIKVGRGVRAVVVAGAHLWTANPLTDVISEIDPVQHRVIFREHLAGRPLKLLASGGRLWVTVLPQPAVPRPGGVRIALAAGDIDSVDPAVSYYGPVLQIEYASGLNLVRFADSSGHAGMRIVPDAASAMHISNHGRTYTFRLRPNLRFSPPSDQKVTARTFQYALERQLTIDSTFGGWLQYGLVGAKRFLAGQAVHVSGIRVRGDAISITRTGEPGLPNLPSLLALPFSSAVPIGWAGPGPSGGVPSAGPYYIRSYIPDDRLLLTRNPNYHGPRRGHIGEYTFFEANDPWRDVQHNRAAYTPDGGPPPSQIAAQIRRYGPDSPTAREGDQRVFVNPAGFPTIVYLVINTRTGRLTNPLVRRAINEAIDRPALAATWGPSAVIVTDQYLAPGIPGFPGNGRAYPLTSPDLPVAHRLMREAHIHLPLHVRLLTSSDVPGAVARVAILTRDLGRIGIKLTPHPVPYATLVQEEDKRVPYDLIDDNHQYPVADPWEFLVGAAANWTEGPYASRLIRANDLPYPQRARAFARLDIALARNVAPLAAYGYLTHVDYFGHGLTDQTFQPFYGMDYTRLRRR